ncbi:Uncharacterised protein [Legionella busanensis]|uniref:Uncharacterized protein n=1 Tax=Legionella busanensis TaxID=190655 RepID=A0A378JME1_9GAMM|nr:FAD-dependent oxidoreductase [Legionella busanensis]STX52394.1 Uncharacterised protein [Legionella busanensis]
MKDKGDIDTVINKNDELEVSNNEGKYDFVVIGAGMAGINAALKLNNLTINGRKPRIALVEAGSEVLPSTCSSQNECNKLHTGMHYLADKETALKCLENAIEFAKEFPDFMASRPGFKDNPCLGRHYLLDKSQVPLKAAEDVIEALIEFYKEKIKEDPANKVFGEPEDFIRELDREKYSFISTSIPYRDEEGKIVGTTSVLKAFQTTEPQVDIPKLQKHLQSEINNNKNITFIPNTYVTSMGSTSDHLGYYICAESRKQDGGKGGEPIRLEASQIINCAWENAAFLNKGLESSASKPPHKDSQGVNRVKVSIEVKLPEKLSHINTSLFSTGPFFSFTNLGGNGRAILTSEYYTNIDSYPTGIEMPVDLEKRIENLRKTSLNEDAKQLAIAIIKDCAECFTDEFKLPLLELVRKELEDQAAEVEIDSEKKIKIHVGIVNITGLQKEYTKKDIHSLNGIMHQRRSIGVTETDLGVVTFLASKMTNAVAGARKAIEIIVEHMYLQEKYNQLAKLIKDKLLLLPRAWDENDMAEINHLLYIDFKQRIREVIESIDYAVGKDIYGTLLESKAEKLTKEILKFKDNKQAILTSPRRDGFFSPANTDAEATAGTGRTNSVLVEPNMVTKKPAETSKPNPDGLNLFF